MAFTPDFNRSYPGFKADDLGQVLGLPVRAVPEKIISKVFTTFWRKSVFSKLTGTGYDNPIVTTDMSEGSGLSYNFTQLYPFDHTKAITNTSQKRGKEQRLTADTCPLFFNRYSFPVISEDIDLKNLASPIKLTDRNVESVMQTTVRHLDDSLVKEATWGLYEPTASRQTIGDMPTDSRVVYGDGKKFEYKYDNAKKLSEVLAAVMPDADAPMTYDTLMLLHSVASIGGYMNDDDFAIRPVNVTPSGKGDIVQYYLFIPTIQKLALKNDKKFEKYVSLRSTTDTVPQPLLGANYITNIEGLYIYELPILNKYQMAIGNSTTPNCSWSFLVGAGALGLGWNKRPAIYQELDVLEMHKRYVSHEIRAHGALRFRPKNFANKVWYNGKYANSFRGVEQGIVHVFNKYDPNAPVQGYNGFGSNVDLENKYDEEFDGVTGKDGKPYVG
jgi:hypothetical protein